MVPKITSAGRSFKGAARYYLHDKGANTSDRVAFVETRNLDTQDPHRAVARMIDTATSANQLKAAAGIKGGRPLQKPVYTFSLAWHPDEAPTRKEQIEAAHEALKALGMEDREALIVAHKDAAHPHVHVMVNRVCPTTGRAASNSDDRLKLSRWAEDHDRRHGRDHCPERRRNNAARRAGEWRKDQSAPRHSWLRRQQLREHVSKAWEEHRAETQGLQPQRKAQYEALWRQKLQRSEGRQAEIKTLYRPIWRDVFKRQRKALKDFDAGLFDRIGYAMKRKKGRLVGTVQAIVAAGDLRRDFIRDQEAERAAIAAQQRQTMTDAQREVTKAWKYDRDTLKAAHKAEDEARYNSTKALTTRVWDSEGSSPWLKNAPPPEVEQDQAPRPVFEQEADRRRPENHDKRDQLDAASEQEKEQARETRKRRSTREIMAESRQRAKGRTRSRTRKPH